MATFHLPQRSEVRLTKREQKDRVLLFVRKQTLPLLFLNRPIDHIDQVGINHIDFLHAAQAFFRKECCLFHPLFFLVFLPARARQRANLFSFSYFSLLLTPPWRSLFFSPITKFVQTENKKSTPFAIFARPTDLRSRYSSLFS